MRANGLLVVALGHLAEPFLGAFPYLEEVGHIGLALLIGGLVHYDMLLQQPLIDAILVWVQD